MAEEQFPDDRCTRCGRRLSFRQAVVDWVPVIVVVIKEVVQYLSS
ncbi:hypothetical protein [Streptomyces massasporeus]|nr:hypothetical protein [Streptomyces massasporeus]GGV75655.1 hypothetical protein GCM10010228_39630 [Streptomyces massasporeus]